MFDFKNVGFVLRDEEQKPVFYYPETSNYKRSYHFNMLCLITNLYSF